MLEGVDTNHCNMTGAIGLLCTYSSWMCGLLLPWVQ